jgi:hypothetical protein
MSFMPTITTNKSFAVTPVAVGHCARYGGRAGRIAIVGGQAEVARQLLRPDRQLRAIEDVVGIQCVDAVAPAVRQQPDVLIADEDDLPGLKRVDLLCAATARGQPSQQQPRQRTQTTTTPLHPTDNLHANSSSSAHFNARLHVAGGR